jgi:integrase
MTTFITLYPNVEVLSGTKKCITALGSVALTQLKPSHIQNAYNEWVKSLSPATIRYNHAILHKALDRAIILSLISRNEAKRVVLPKKNQTEMTCWDENEVSQFLESTKGSRYYPLFYLALTTGARRGELLGLRWRDFKDGELNISRGLHQLRDNSYVFLPPKTLKSSRTITLGESVVAMLEAYRAACKVQKKMLGLILKEDDLIFSDVSGDKPWRPNSITRAWAVAVKRAGVRQIRFHDCRHTHASLLLKAGVNVLVVSQRLGHRDISTTYNVYSHLLPGMGKEAATVFDKIMKPKATAENFR